MTTEVRAYRPDDRAAIEDIAYRTGGFMGESAAAFWGHRESFAAIWIAPYLDGEPESAFVATVDGVVCGYLTGCVKTATFTGPGAVAAREVKRHWLFFRPGVAPLLWRAELDRIRDRWSGYPRIGARLRDPRWPSHFHLNLLPEARGIGLGRALIQAWLGRVRDVESPGCHVGAMIENRRSVRLFQAMGFEPHEDPVPIPGMRGPAGERLHLLMMVRTTEPGGKDNQVVKPREVVGCGTSSISA